MTENTKPDDTAIFAVAFFMANILFVICGGVFYIALWVLYVRRYKKSSPMIQRHLKQALIAASLSSAMFVAVNIYIVATGGYIPLSRSAILAIEFYGLLIIPMFMGLGVFALSKAIRNEDVRYPLIGRLV